MSAAEGQKIADMTVHTVNSIRTDDNFLLFWKLIKQKASDLNINQPVLPRQRKCPRIYEDGASEGKFPGGFMYFEALDLVVCGIKGCLDQPWYKVYSNLEGVLFKAVRRDKYDEDLQYVVDFYKGDLDCQQLSMQLGVLSSNISSDSAQDLMPTYLKVFAKSFSSWKVIIVRGLHPSFTDSCNQCSKWMIFQLSTTCEALLKIYHEVEQPYGFACSLKSYWSALFDWSWEWIYPRFQSLRNPIWEILA